MDHSLYAKTAINGMHNKETTTSPYIYVCYINCVTYRNEWALAR